MGCGTEPRGGMADQMRAPATDRSFNSLSSRPPKPAVPEASQSDRSYRDTGTSSFTSMFPFNRTSAAVRAPAAAVQLPAPAPPAAASNWSSKSDLEA